MRLRARDVLAIKAATEEVFGSGAVVRVFGSRVDENARGGDIDLHVVLSSSTRQDDATAYHRALRNRLGERAIDVVCYKDGDPLRSIDKTALDEGILL